MYVSIKCILKQFPGCNLAFLSHVSQKNVHMKEYRVGIDKGAPEIKTDVESRSTWKCKGLSVNKPPQCISQIYAQLYI